MVMRTFFFRLVWRRRRRLSLLSPAEALFFPSSEVARVRMLQGLEQSQLEGEGADSLPERSPPNSARSLSDMRAVPCLCYDTMAGAASKADTFSCFCYTATCLRRRIFSNVLRRAILLTSVMLSGSLLSSFYKAN